MAVAYSFFQKYKSERFEGKGRQVHETFLSLASSGINPTSFCKGTKLMSYPGLLNPSLQPDTPGQGLDSEHDVRVTPS